MELKIIFLIILASASNVLATPGYSQEAKVSLDMENTRLEKVMDEIERQSDFYFIFNQKQVDINRVVDIHVKNKMISAVLTDLFKGTNINYSVFDGKILLTNETSSDNSKVVVSKTTAQSKVITGKVTDSKGETLPGVNILVKGTLIGATTDINGKYSIEVPDANGVLVFSFVGYTTKEVPMAGQSVVNLVLEAASTNLDEVVVVGYGTVKRSDLVGSTSSLSNKDIKSLPSARVDQVLQGRSAGIAIQNNSAGPDGAFTIRIRGSNSLTGSNDPLVVIDGFIGGDLASLNPNDIASIEILKDASSTAIYGSRGANGVIMVTTKKGGVNKTVVEYNNFMNFTSISKKMDLLTAAEYAETVNANRSEVGRPEVFTATQIADWKTNGGTDWQDQIFRKAMQQNHQVSVSGGNDKNIYYVSGNYTNNEGIIKGSSFSKYSLRSNMESDISKKIKIGVNLFLNRSESHPAVTGSNSTSNQDNSPTQGALIWGAVQPVYGANGLYSLPASNYGSPAVKNPLAMAIEPINDNIGLRAEINTFLNYNIIKGLSARFILGTRLIDNELSQYLNTKPAGNIGDASASITTNRFTVMQNTNQLNYQTKIGNVHDISLTAAYEQQREIFNSSYAGARGFSSDATTYNNLGLGTKPQIPTSSNTRKDIISYVGRTNYTYKGKYLASLTGRYDGASVFGTQKWGFFPSAALAWRVTSEGFMSNYKTISNLKIRTSYGVTGSQAVNPYASLSQLNTSQAYAIGSSVATGIGLGTLGNPDLRWEKTAQLNLGLDLGLFKGRLVLTADYYNKETSDLLMSVPLPRISGYTNILRNIGKVQNRGFEVNLGGDPLDGKLKWNTNANFAMNKNKVIALSGVNSIPMGTTSFPNFGNTIFLEVGQPIGILKGYIQDGIWSVAETEMATSFGSIPGAPKYIDQNKDGKITSADIAIMGSTMPKFTYGWSNDFSYMNFDMNILIQGSQGNKVYNLTRIRSERTSSDADANDRRILNRWSVDNQNTNVPSFKGSSGYEQVQSSRWLEDGSYLRIKNITLGYNLPSPVLNRIKITSARFFVSGVNLFTFTKYTGYDPESSTDVGILGGIDMAPYPSTKMYTVGMNVKF